MVGVRKKYTSSIPTSLAQIHAALAYYYDHKPALDTEIEEGLRLAEQQRNRTGESPARKRLAALGRQA